MGFSRFRERASISVPTNSPRVAFKKQLQADRRFDLETRLAWLLFDLSAKHGYSFMSVAKLAERLNASPRTVQYKLAHLAEMGLFRVERGGGRGKANRYYPVMPVGVRSSDDAEVFAEPDPDGGQDGDSPQVGSYRFYSQLLEKK